MEIKPPKKTKNKGYALAMIRWDKEPPDPNYFSKIAKLRWKEWRRAKRSKLSISKKAKVSQNRKSILP